MELVEQMRPHSGDEAQLIAIAKQGRQQLEELFAQEREAARQRNERAGWGGQNAEADDEGRSTPR